MPNIKKRSDGRYTATIRFNGQKYFFYGSTKKVALQKRDEFLAKKSICKNYNANLTLLEWTQEWLKIKAGTISPKTLESYEWMINKYILPHLGGMKLVDISPLNIQKLIEQINHLSNRTISYALTILGSILKEAVRYEYINKNVATLVKKPKKEKLHEMVTLTKEQVQKFLNVIPLDETRILFKVAFTTGLRRSELLGLRWQDIDFKKNTLSINQTVITLNNSYVISKTTKNASSRRTISVDSDTMNELKKHQFIIQKRRIRTYNWCNNDLVFPGKCGGPRDPKAISKACKKYAAKIGVPNFTMHGTRHTHATLLIEAGVNFKVIQTRLGHASYTQTMDTYSHVTPIMEADVIEKISNIF